MLYVGLTEDHKGSATTFAHVVGAQVISQLVGLNSSTEYQANNITGQLYESVCSLLCVCVCVFGGGNWGRGAPIFLYHIYTMLQTNFYKAIVF